MAESGRVYSKYGRNSRLYVDWVVSETDVENNRWLIEWEAGVVVERNDYWYSNAVRIDSIYIGGGASLGSGTYSNLIGTGTYNKISGSKWVNANPDGSQSIDVSISGWFYDYGNRSGSKNYSLPTIPRKAKLHSASDFNDEENPVITYTNAAGEAVDSLMACISLDGDNDDVEYRNIPKTDESYTFDISAKKKETLSAACYDSNSVFVWFILKTTIGDQVYTEKLRRIFSLKNAEPVVTASVVDINPATISLTGDNRILVRNHSEAQVSMNAVAQKGATIDDTECVIRNGRTMVIGTSHKFKNAESNEFVFRAEDSRGNVGEVTVTPEMIEYVNPTCNIVNTKPDATGDMVVACYGLYFNGFFGAVANTLTVQYRYKEYGGSFGDWVSMDVTKDENTYYASASLTGLDYKTTYTFEVRTSDFLETVTSVNPMVRGLPVFHWGENDFVFEVPVYFKAGANGLPENFASGNWTPALNESAVGSYAEQSGWFVKVDQVVTAGFSVKAVCNPGYEATAIIISGLPFLPVCAASGGGLCSGVYVDAGCVFQCFVAEENGEISTRTQEHRDANLTTTKGCGYRQSGGEIVLSGIVTFLTTT